jgi:hypothetical protein
MNTKLLNYGLAIFQCKHAGARPPLSLAVIQKRQTTCPLMKGFYAVMLGASALMITGTANATLITNGDFTNGGTGWTFLSSGCTGGAYYLNGGSTAGSTAPAVYLNGCGYDAHSPGMQQQVTGLAIGAIYDLTWDYAYANGGGAYGTSFGVYLDSAVIDLSEQPGGWITRTVSFMATSATHLIGFEAETDSRTPGTVGRSDRAFYVDNVALAKGATLVPEPSTLTVFFLSLLGIIGLKRRV